MLIIVFISSFVQFDTLIGRRRDPEAEFVLFRSYFTSLTSTECESSIFIY
jgi:hypothetical protein